jgi:hypothetical protein
MGLVHTQLGNNALAVADELARVAERSAVLIELALAIAERTLNPAYSDHMRVTTIQGMGKGRGKVIAVALVSGGAIGLASLAVGRGLRVDTVGFEGRRTRGDVFIRMAR